MRKYIITGEKKLAGEVVISGSKNVALKAIVAACLTDEKVVIKNVPLIADVYTMIELTKEIGGNVEVADHTLEITVPHITTHSIPLEAGAKTRTSSLFLAPLLARVKEAIIPNPGGCRIGARPIDRIVAGIEKMGAEVTYHSEDGYFHAKAPQGIHGTTYEFEKNSHTGTETLLLSAVLAEGTTVIKNAALEPEVDSLITLLNGMGAQIKRLPDKEIEVTGVKKLHGTEFTLPQDRNEVVTFAVASVLTGGNIWIKDVDFSVLEVFMDECKKAGIEVEKRGNDARFYAPGKILPTDILTAPHPGFMTDWQGVWAILMTQAEGRSTLHEAVYENRFGYKEELEKMGAKINFIPEGIEKPETFYNFNYDPSEKYQQKIEILGKSKLHNAVLEMSDLRAGATLVLGALVARGASIIYGVEQVERGYEDFNNRLRKLGAAIILDKDII
ncbi:MAG: UDP-N-acetylglucosamine 1-carboxyvinyltransferase [Candidatus Levyibacteriota bacterium]